MLSTAPPDTHLLVADLATRHGPDGIDTALSAIDLALATDLTSDDLEPEPETTELRTQLMSAGQRIG
jgi:hypothetical protein